jgi:hypothetical protein
VSGFGLPIGAAGLSDTIVKPCFSFFVGAGDSCFMHPLVQVCARRWPECTDLALIKGDAPPMGHFHFGWMQHNGFTADVHGESRNVIEQVRWERFTHWRMLTADYRESSRRDATARDSITQLPAGNVICSVWRSQIIITVD